jgi:hypothetical protein
LRLRAVIKDGFLFERQFVAISDAGPIRVAVAIYLQNHDSIVVFCGHAIPKPILRVPKNG